MKRRTFLLLVLLFACSFAADSFAVVTDFTWDPPDPLIGENVTYTAVHGGGGESVSSCKWEYRYVGTCSVWVEDTTNTTESVTYCEHRPGSWDIRLTVTYIPDAEGNVHAPTVITKQVTIGPATKFTIIGGLDEEAGWNDTITVLFRVDGPSRQCGPGIEANLAQELITNKWMQSPPLDQPYPPDDTEWTPDAGDPKFQLMLNIVEDTKGQQGLPPEAWNDIQVGAFYKADQAIRIKYVDPCGVTHYINLGSVRLHRMKTNIGNWKILQF